MDINYLNSLFNPRSIAVIGATERENSVGAKVFTNLLSGNFKGNLYPVNPKYKELYGQPCYRSILEIQEEIDLAIIVTPAKTVTAILKEIGKKNVGAVIIISAGFSEMGKEGKELENELLAIARQYNIRIMGPNCLGIILPHIHLNATFNNIGAIPGNLSLISQSGAICAAILDWAYERNIGFSSVISLGNAMDIDFRDALDYASLDPNTKSILLYIEGVRHARHFMSSLRAASRMKPVVVIKGGRFDQGSRAALSHTGAIIGRDDVFEAAIKRAGAVRVLSLEELFSAAKILASNYRAKGDRLAIITNGGGAGVMAADHAEALQLTSATFTKETIDTLNKILPKNWSHQNPIDILGDATPLRYAETIKACINDENTDAIVTILVPVAMAEPTTVAKKIITDTHFSTKPLIPCWMGGNSVKHAKKLFSKHLIPYYDTPEAAVESFSYLANYYKNQKLLLTTPKILPSSHKTADIHAAQTIIKNALHENRKTLTIIESKNLLKIFDIPISPSIVAKTSEEACRAGDEIGFPLVMKIYSPDISHKQDVGGVKLNIKNRSQLQELFTQMMNEVSRKAPNAKILGVTIEKMEINPNNRELMIGIMHDPVFGPVISFGAGGSLVEVIKDTAIDLPPLNQELARRLIEQTKISKALAEFRNMPAVNVTALINTLLRVSEMICQLPQIKELDINPLLANDKEVIAIDARIIIDSYVPSTLYDHLVIHPYPEEESEPLILNDGTNITIRPIKPEDAELEQEFTKNLSPEAKHFRFGGFIKELSPEMLMRFTQIDYDREMAFIAIINENNKDKNIGVARYIINPNQESCEFALVVADEWQGKGVGTELMRKLSKHAKVQGLKVMRGDITANNLKMLQLVKELGFNIFTDQTNPNIKIAEIALGNEIKTHH